MWCEFFWGNNSNNKILDKSLNLIPMLIEKSRLDIIQENARKLQHSVKELKEGKIPKNSFTKKMKVVCTQQNNFQLQVVVLYLGQNREEHYKGLKGKD